MEYTKLGTTGTDVSRICLGCMSYGVSERGTHPWSLGADVGLFATPAILTALRPLNVALLLPSIGWAIGLLASWLLGNGEDDDLYWSLGIAAGQLACVASLPGTVLG